MRLNPEFVPLPSGIVASVHVSLVTIQFVEDGVNAKFVAPHPQEYCGILSVLHTRVAAPLVQVVVRVISSCFKSSAACVAVETGLFASLVLLTLPNHRLVLAAP